MGLAPTDAGPLRCARFLEAMAHLNIHRRRTRRRHKRCLHLIKLESVKNAFSRLRFPALRIALARKQIESTLSPLSNRIMNLKFLSLACAVMVATTGFSLAGGFGFRGGGVAVGVKWGGGGRYYYGHGPRYVSYRPYYRPWYGPRVVVASPPVVVAPRVVAPAAAYTAVPYSNSLVVAAQYRLQKLGYYRGGVDGAFGPLTAQATRGYQGG